MSNLIECYGCGKMVSSDLDICPKCTVDLSINDTEDSLVEEEECCLNCRFYDASSKIECPILAKKWDRDRIEIDRPDTMHCESHKEIE